MTETATEPDVAAQPTGIRMRGWESGALAALLIGTAIAYLVNLSSSGWANSFYAAAVQSGAKSWKAFFFGSSDWHNTITVDKTPAALWPMEISARIFGMNSWSMLVPQVLMAVAAVAIVWVTLRRSHGPAAGLLGGLALALTPVVTLMFRFNNPDALLVLLMVAAMWAMTRALEDGRWRWLVLCGGFVGLGFLAKQLQVLLVVPALAVVYLFAGPPALGKRITQLLAAAVSVLVAAGWWVLVAELWPADSRPYFGGSKNNSIIELALGYNGLQRLGLDSDSGFGPPGGGGPGRPGGGHGGGAHFGSQAGITRMFQETVGGQIAWLIPAAAVLCVAAIVVRGKATRTDIQRSALLLWGGWALVTALVFTFMKGIFHQYYTVALAPGVAGAAALGVVALWRDRHRLWVRIVLAVASALTVVTAVVLLDRTPDFVPWLRWVLAVVGVIATLALLIPLPRALAAATALVALMVALAGPLAYSIQTIATAHNGGIVLAGPRTAGGFGFGPPGGFGAGCRPGGSARPGNPVPPGASNIPVPSGNPAPSVQGGQVPGTPGPTCPSGGNRGGGPGGMFGGPNKQVLKLLRDNGSGYDWTAATISAMGAADLQLDSGYAVMPIGGFSGRDPAPTLEQFQAAVDQHRIHYFIASQRGGPGRGQDSAGTRITQWVQQNYTPTTIGGSTVYDLTGPKKTR
ncbi:MAG: glycosyltransferase family 39 protein [Nocardia sp.]|nr:glycosyltransferase family 39 protein [Nocardia sp.]